MSDRYVRLLLVVLVIALGVVACSKDDQPDQPIEIKLAPVSVLPIEVQQAEPKVREAYQFAVANQAYLANFPCYCGCGAMGHKSNLDCYIDRVNDDGTIIFGDHAFL